MSGGDSGGDPPGDEKPIVLLHRLPTFELPYQDRLSGSFTLVDPPIASLSDFNSESHRQYLTTNATEVRAVLCVGPSPIDAQTLNCLPSLECVVVSATGVDKVDLAECGRRGIAVANAGDAFSEDVADFAVGLLIDVLRKISASDRFVRTGSWPNVGQFPLGYRLRGKQVGIVGLGTIGSMVAERLIPFGCSIAYNSRKRKQSVSFPYYDSAYDLALNSDVLVICCCLTNETRHIINKDVMTALGKEGVIINVGRGALIDEKEMVQLLLEGKLGGAGLDVFENEPNVPTELYLLDNVVLTPHRAVTTPESFMALEEVMVENLEAFFSNRPLRSPVMLD
ncbi:hypothetical protein Ancab_032565 [Ancistrocladus abbreviatus]